MVWKIPGTVLECERSEAETLEQTLDRYNFFTCVYMRDISKLTGLEAYTVQNWVKRGFLEPPVNRHYTKDQVCRIFLINMLKGVFPMDKICRMLSYVNGKLDDTSDDIIPDAELYFMFVRLAARAKALDKDPDGELDRELADYKEPCPGAKERIRRVLKIMVLGWLACRMRQKAEEKLENLLEGEMNRE